MTKYLLTVQGYGCVEAIIPKDYSMRTVFNVYVRQLLDRRNFRVLNELVQSESNLMQLLLCVKQTLEASTRAL